jgi:hypothetical protein
VSGLKNKKKKKNITTGGTRGVSAYAIGYRGFLENQISPILACCLLIGGRKKKRREDFHILTALGVI